MDLFCMRVSNSLMKKRNKPKPNCSWRVQSQDVYFHLFLKLPEEDFFWNRSSSLRLASWQTQSPALLWWRCFDKSFSVTKRCVYPVSGALLCYKERGNVSSCIFGDDNILPIFSYFTKSSNLFSCDQTWSLENKHLLLDNLPEINFLVSLHVFSKIS